MDYSYFASGNVLPAQYFSWHDWSGLPFYQVKDEQSGSSLDDWRDYHTELGDVDGDGKADIVAMLDRYVGSNSGLRRMVYLSRGDGSFYQASDQTNGSLANWGYFHSELADVNGDGKADIVALRDKITGSYALRRIVYLSNGDGTFTQASDQTNGSAASWENFHAAMADVNGDGRSDIVALRDQMKGSGVLRRIVYRSNGDGTFAQANDEENGSTASWVNNIAMMADVNGDGRADIVALQDQWATATALRRIVYLSNGDGSFTQDSDNATGSAIYWPEFHASMADINGDGKSDIVALRAPRSRISLFFVGILLEAPIPGSLRRIGYLSDGPQPDLLTAIKNGRGGRIDVSYKPAPQVSGAIVPTLSTLPEVANKSPRSLVTQITTDDGLGRLAGTSYEYYNGKIYGGARPERANLGFQWIKKTDINTGNYLRTLYYQTKLYRGLVDLTMTFDSAGKQYVAIKNGYNYRTDDAAYPDIAFVYPANKTTLNYNGTTDYKGYLVRYNGYDQYGNCLSMTDYGDPGNGYDNVETYIDYAVNSSLYIIKPYRVRTRAADLDNSSYNWATESRTYYDGLALGSLDRGLVTRTEAENGAVDIASTFGYDEWGNCIRTKDARATAGEYPGYTTQTGYESSYRTCIVSSTNALGQTAYTYYDALMRPVQVKDSNGVSAYSEYDMHNNAVKSILPGDTSASPSSQIIYNYVDKSAPYSVISKVKDPVSGGTLDTYTYYDGLGRVIQVKTEAETAGQWRTVDSYYDASGRSYRTSVPYLWTGTPYGDSTSRDGNQKYTLTEYDPTGRPWRVTKPDKSYKQMFYGLGSTMVVDELGHVTETEVDANVEYTKEYTGVYPNQVLYAVTTTKSARGGVRITDAKGNITTTYLDMLGRKVKTEDPDMGTWNFLYDPMGNLISQTDAKGQIINFSYDKLGRLVHKDYPTDEDVYYYYDEAGHGYGQGRLTRLVRGSYGESYSYNARGQVTAKTVTIDGESRTESYSYYAGDGRLYSTTYPDGEVVINSYNSDGTLAALKGASDYVTNIDYNAWGKVTALTYGNGITNYYDYYDSASEYDNSAGSYYSYRLRKIYTSNSAIYNVQYEYDDAGNVRKKTDLNNAAYSEGYLYDTLNRLVQATSVVYGTKNYNYDEIGNLTRKGDRYFSYGDANHVHGVSFDGQNNYSYDANGDMREKTIPDQAFLEVGKVTLDNTIDGGVSAAVHFQKTYTNPVVVAYIMTRNGGQSVDVRVKDVTATGCTIFSEEPDNQDHNPEDVGYLVVEAGSYQLPGGVKVEAGTVTTGSVHREGSDFGGEQISFQNAFTAAPVLLHTLNSYNNQGFMSTVSPSVSGSGFTLQQEAGGSGSSASIETIGWIALESGVAGTVNNLSYETGRSQDGSDDGVDDTEHLISYGSGFAAAPIVLMDGYTGNGTDGYWTRGSGTQTTAAHGVFAEEDQVGDTERNHMDEGFGWFAIAGQTVIALTTIRQYSYDEANRLVGIDVAGSPLAQYAYGSGEGRIKKVENGITIRYFFGNYQEEFDGSSTNVIKYYGGYAKRSTKEGLVYFHRDHLGSSSRVTNASGAVVASMGYTPYGSDSYSTGNTTVKYRFTGQEKDATGLYYYGARYYDPELGRFISPDTIVPGGGPQALNRYAYVLNNPLRYTDPTGHSQLSVFIEGFGDSVSDFASGIGDAFAQVWDASVDMTSTVMSDWLGIDSLELTFTLGPGFGPSFTIGLDFKNRQFSVGVGMGIGGSVGVNGQHVGAGAHFSVGYNSAGNSVYVAGGGSLGSLHLSATASYAFEYGEYYVGVTASAWGMNVTVGYGSSEGFVYGGGYGIAGWSSSGGWSIRAPEASLNTACGGTVGIGAAYNFKSGGWKVSGKVTTLCFTAGTKVETKAGAKNIEDIQAGDLVLSLDEETGEVGYKPVLRKFVRETAELVKVKVGAETIEATPEHPFRVVTEASPAGALNVAFGIKPALQGRWVKAGELQPGMKLLSSDGTMKEVTQVEREARTVPVYNFEVADWHTYCVGAAQVVVHNSCAQQVQMLKDHYKKLDVAEQRDLWDNSGSALTKVLDFYFGKIMKLLGSWAETGYGLSMKTNALQGGESPFKGAGSVGPYLLFGPRPPDPGLYRDTLSEERMQRYMSTPGIEIIHIYGRAGSADDGWDVEYEVKR